MLAAAPYRTTVPGAGPGALARVLACVSALGLAPACESEEWAQGSVQVAYRTTYALTGGELVSVNGTYQGCKNRSGSWSLPIALGAALDHSPLSVVLNDAACSLTLASLHTGAGVLAAKPTLLLGTRYRAAPAAFGSPLDFYANARLSTAVFGEDFLLTILYSDDLNLASDGNTAIAIRPTVVSNTPRTGAGEVSIATRPTATFSVTIASVTITALTFLLRRGATRVASSVAYDAATCTATLTPDSPLGLGVLYEARVTTGVENSGNTSLAADFVWTFTTSACSQAPVELRSARSFSLLAFSKVHNAGPTTVPGDLGVGRGGFITGFPPGTVAGTIHTADSAATAAQVDLGVAYTEAAARRLCPVMLDARMGSRTLVPGLYGSDTRLAVTAGDLVLDAKGEADAVFVLQVGSKLDTEDGSRVILRGGAKASNVFWQVGSSATLAAESQFAGTIIADGSITLRNGATLTGRALAHGGAVTLDTKTLAWPTP